jgi:Spy/CpxP family protein refolding chaperone
MLGLSALVPMLARAQNPKAAEAPLGFWLRSGDSGSACVGSYGYLSRRITWPLVGRDSVALAVQHLRMLPAPLHGALPPVTSFEQALFAPELVMQRQDALALTADQRKSITETLKTLETETIDLQWKVQAEQAKLIALLEQRPINESAASAQMAKLLDVEAAVKQKHFLSLARIKNTLTDAQVQQLNVFSRCGAPT